MEIGSENHKELFCKTFLDTYCEYDPQTLPWPELEPEAKDLLHSIPFWEEAYSREQQAGLIIGAYAETIQDSLLKEAIALQGREETRHASLLNKMMDHYGITIPTCPIPTLPVDLEDAFCMMGYEECFDSFFAFGLFKLAQQKTPLPEGIFQIFDMLIDEEARHNLFFVNWMAYHQIHNGQDSELLRTAHSLWYYGKAATRLIQGILRGTGNAPGFTLTGSAVLPGGFSIEDILATCLEENKRRMNRFDSRLLRPEVLPGVTHAAYEALKLLHFPQSKAA
jgi:hypothetical protein